MKLLFKILKYLLLFSLLLVVIIGAGATWLLGTESGVNFLVAQGKKYAPGTLEIEQVEGTLLGELHLTNLSYEQENTVDAKVEDLLLSWKPSALFSRTAHIEQLHVTGVDVKLPEPAEKTSEEDKPKSSEPPSIPDIKLPIKIIIEDVQVNQVAVQTGDGKPFEINSSQLQAQLIEKFELQKLAVDSPLFTVNAQGDAQLTTPHPLNLNADWTANIDNVPPLSGHATIAGDTNKLIVNHELAQPAAVNLQAVANDLLGALTWNADIDWQQIQYPFDSEDIIVDARDGKISGSGDLDNYQVTLNADVTGKDIPQGKWDVAVKADKTQAHIETLEADILTGKISGVGFVKWVGELAGDIKLKTEHIDIKPFWKDMPDGLFIDTEVVAKLQDKAFNIEQLAVMIPQINTKVTATGTGSIEDGGKDLDVKMDFQNLRWPLKGKNILVNAKDGTLSLTGSADDYNVTLNADVAGKDIPKGKWLVKATGDKTQADVNTLEADILTGKISGKAFVKWADGLAADVNLSTKHIDIKPFWKDMPNGLFIDSAVVAKLEDQQFNLQQLAVMIPQIKTKVSATGTGSIEDGGKDLDVKLQWQNLRWPLKGDELLAQVKQGEVDLTGSAKAYKLTLNTDVSGKDIPKSQIQLLGQGSLEQIDIEKLTVNTLDGVVNLLGKVAWKPQVKWDIKVAGQDINPAKQWKDLDGNIGLDLAAKGQLADKGVQTVVNVNGIKGTFRKYPLDLQAQAKVNGQRYEINQLDFKSGKTRLTANGVVDKNIKLDWALNAPNLNTLVPQAKGSIKGKGKVLGALDKPHVIAKLNAQKLQYEDNKVQSLKVDADVDLDGGRTLRLDVLAKDVQQAGNQVLKQASIKSTGSMKSHLLTTKVETPEQNVLLKLKGGFDIDKTEWKGFIQQLDADTGIVGTWKNNRAAQLIASPKKADLGQLCLQQEQAQICTQANWKVEGDIKAKVELKTIPLAIAKQFFPPDLDLTGDVQGKLDAQLLKNGQIRSDVNIGITSGELTTMLAGEKEVFKHQGGKLEVDIKRSGLIANLVLDLLEQSHVKANVNMPKFNSLAISDNQKVNAQINAKFGDISILPTFVEQAENVQGEVLMQANVKGTVKKPQINGELKVVDGAADLPDFGLELRDLNVSVKDDGKDKLDIYAGLTSGDGKLELTGDAFLPIGRDWAADLKLKGEDFTAIDQTEIYALISPDMHITANPKKLHVGGKLTIPTAHITPPEASATAIKVTKDIEIVNPKEPKPEPKPKSTGSLEVSSDVTVVLGDDVQFEGLGFKSNFAGDLTVHSEGSQLPVGTGEIKIVNGRYKAYGQDLHIDNGRVLYSGGRLENPGLDIRAYRAIDRDVVIDGSRADGVTAGVYIHGSAQNPKIDLYSRPNMDQSNILSYIVLGRPANEAANGEGGQAALLAAAASLPLKEGDGIMKDLGDTFGLDEAGISTEDGIQDAALTLGKYLTPDLYISYGIGLFDAKNILKMRYQLTKRWTIETSQSGSDSGVDFNYSLER
ncbi:translocation/assembly module TamB domain-containing protein [Candidatus Albibeggiatoa sp. nov. NOAA]|uniref:translocation/assembly module TamB domain-containing protein n=1 Tax=Candidatus Albibeggiatoa sp. nov. NOAA TaxID=3162724 RepID=UPI003302AB58|nr:translocation/assembly module TamB domain-containing protein [Thiotrichaceae bacterium]